MDKFTGYKDLVYNIIGSAMKVHSVLNYGIAEALYQESLYLELLDNGIKSEREKEICCHYKHHQLNKTYKADLVVGDILVELKSVAELLPEHRAQLFNYLRLTKYPVGVLINFGKKNLQGERYGFIEETNECVLLDKRMKILNYE
ncbi:GxxExxY protein [uncultured Prevotella sp.]|uniref:GxxExxY protein n=1 Tax=uncultured Prevotella sp. TaxID=159272 RepID=UPI002636E0EB|nr:GxxExxY protein [uncultured Prevotella sp.]